MKIFSKSQVIQGLINVLAAVPQCVWHKVAVPVLSFFLWYGRSDFRRITEINIEICFQSKSREEKKSLAKASVTETLKTFFEFPYVVMSDTDSVLKKIIRMDGQHYVDEAIKKGKGVLFLSPHLGNWEILGIKLGKDYPLTGMFKPGKIESINRLLKAAREGGGGILVPTNKKGVIKILKALKRGEATGMLPDQIPDSRSGCEFVSFFGQEAATMTLVSGLLQKTEAVAIACFAKRLSCGNFEVIYRPVDADLYDKDSKVSARGLNKTVEMLIAMAPEQYQWIYKRFRTGANGKTGIYKKA